MNIEQEFIVAWTTPDGETESAIYETAHSRHFYSYEEADSFLEGLNSPEHFAYLSIVIKRV